MRSHCAIPRGLRLLRGLALLPALLALWAATPALASESPSPQATGRPATPARSAAPAPPAQTAPPSTAEPPTLRPSTPQPPTAAPPPPPTAVPQPAAVAPPPATPAPQPARPGRAPVPAATPVPAPTAAPTTPAPTPAATPARTATPAPTSRPAPTVPAPQTNAPPKQQSAVPGVFGQPQGAVDALDGLWLPAGLVLLVLLGAAALVLRSRRKQGATVWMEESGWVSIPDAEAAMLQRFSLTEDAAESRLTGRDVAPTPDPAPAATPEQHRLLTPVEPVAEGAVRPLVPSLAPSAAPVAATNGAGAVTLRPPAGPTSPDPIHPGPRHRPELKVHHHQTGGPPDAGAPHSPEVRLRRFVDDWTGVPLEADGDPHPSMALLRAYAGQVLGAPPVWGAPMDIPDTYDMGHYVWVRESPYRAPAPGDAVVWAPRPEDASDGGHVAIFVRGDASGFDAFDGDGSAPGVRHHADYVGVIGWLHPIGG